MPPFSDTSKRPVRMLVIDASAFGEPPDGIVQPQA